MKKKSSYQKLKEENAHLRQDIYEILGYAGEIPKMQTSMIWRFNIDAGNMLMMGSPTIVDKDAPVSLGEGIWKHINKK